MRLWSPKMLACVAAALASCAAPGPRTGTEVTRFHLEQPIPLQAVNLQPAADMDEKSLAFSSYRAAVAEELLRLGFEPIDGDDADLIAVVGVRQTREIQAPKRSPFSIGIGAGSYGSGGGVGVGTNTNVGGSSGGEIDVVRLEVRMLDRAENAVLWEGDAVRTSAPGSQSAPVALVRELAAAMFRDFPGKSGETVVVD